MIWLFAAGAGALIIWLAFRYAKKSGKLSEKVDEMEGIHGDVVDAKHARERVDRDPDYRDKLRERNTRS